MNNNSTIHSEIERRKFMKWVGLSSLSLALPFTGCSFESNPKTDKPIDLTSLKNVFDIESISRELMGEDALLYLNGGADDLRTVKLNAEAYKEIQIRARRLIDVRNISTNVELFGQKLDNPIILSPVGFQQFFHPDGEIATAKASVLKNHQMIVSSVSNYSVIDIAKQSNANLWFQLYPTPDREITKLLLDRAKKAGCKVCVLTVDTPVVGNRERSGTTLMKLIQTGKLKMGNFEGILPDGLSFTDPGMTWDMIDWLKENCEMKIVVKGIVTKEDAALAKERGVDGIIVSNHGGRQLESDRATIECLPEVIEAIKGEIPVLIDGGIRRGTDIFKALAIGAKAVCIGRPFCWGLGALGQQGVELTLEILKAELIRDMQLAGTTSIEKISREHIIIN